MALSDRLHKARETLFSETGFAGGFSRPGSMGLTGRLARGTSAGLRGGLKGGFEWSVAPRGLALNTLFSAYSFYQAPMGHKVARTTASFTGTAIAAALGGFVAGPVGSVVAAMFLSNTIGKPIERGMDLLRESGAALGRINMGDSPDPAFLTANAYTMRMRAAKELSGSLFNARQHLGKEALLLHQ